MLCGFHKAELLMGVLGVARRSGNSWTSLLRGAPSSRYSFKVVRVSVVFKVEEDRVKVERGRKGLGWV